MHGFAEADEAFTLLTDCPARGSPGLLGKQNLPKSRAHGPGCHPESFRDQLKFNVPTLTEERLALPYQHPLAGDALPVAVSIHPSVGKAIGAIKCLAIFTCAFLVGQIG